MKYNIKYDKRIYEDFYNPLKILSYSNVLYYISLGQRSIGKTTGFLIHGILEYLIHGKEFIYLRRDKDEIDVTKLESVQNAINVINKFYRKFYSFKTDLIFSFKCENNIYYINGDKDNNKDWELIGYAIPLSLQHKYKSNNYSNTYYVFYDEFISFNKKYLGGQKNMYYEVYALESLLQTIDRNIGEAYSNRVRCICIGNSISFYNPLLLQLGIDKYLKTNTKFLHPKNSYYVVEQTNEVTATKNKEHSLLYKASSDYNKKYAFDNETNDNKEFIENIHGKLEPLINMKYENITYSIYYNEDYDIYIDDKPCTIAGIKTFALTNNEHSINTYLIDNWRNTEVMKLVRDCYIRGRVKFKNARCKFMINQYFKYD